MKKFKCNRCGNTLEMNKLERDYYCENCGVDASMIEEILEENARIPISEDNPSIERISNKCINCGMCYKTCREVVGIKYDIDKFSSPICVNCGACRLTCPTGAIKEKYSYKIVKDFIENTDKCVVVLTSPAVRVSIGEEFGFEPGTFLEGKMVSALKRLGFDYVFDTTFGADLTTVEEAYELLTRINNNIDLPMFSSCCPAWVKYMEMYHPNKLNHLSTCKSPIAMESSLIRHYFSKIKGLKKSDIIIVALTPCTAKKYETLRDELKDTNYVITTSELALYLKEDNIDFKNLENAEYDSIFGKGSGGGTIFGTTGGVSESVLRTLHYFITGKEEDIDLVKTRGLDNIKEISLKIKDKNINVAIINGLKNVFPILEKLEKGEKIEYDFIEVMNCTGGCIGGGGQPLGVISKMDEIRKKRLEGLYKDDETSNIRCSYNNPDIIKIYNDYLVTYGSNIAHYLLHTNYFNKRNLTNN